MDWTALAVTLRLAVATTLVLLGLGIPLAYWLSHSRSRLRPWVEAAVALPLVLPPTVLGFYLLAAAGPSAPGGRAILAVTGNRLPFTFAGILVGSVLYNLPFAVRPFVAAISAVDRRLVEASWCLGASRLRTFATVSLPLAWPGVAAGIVLTFAHCLGEFGVVLMLGGNIPGVTRTLSIAIYDDVQALDYAAAGRSSLALLAMSLGLLAVAQAVTRRGLRAR